MWRARRASSARLAKSATGSQAHCIPGLAERLKAHAWKACVLKGTVGSNFTLSAIQSAVAETPRATPAEPEKSQRFRGVLAARLLRIRTGDCGFRAGKTAWPAVGSNSVFHEHVSPGHPAHRRPSRPAPLAQQHEATGEPATGDRPRLHFALAAWCAPRTAMAPENTAKRSHQRPAQP